MDLVFLLSIETGGVEVDAEKENFIENTGHVKHLPLVTILASNAHRSATKGTNDVKFTKVVDIIWMDELYRSK